MNKRTPEIDARGFPCPKPLILTKKYLTENAGTSFTVIVDNYTARKNIERFLKDNRITCTAVNHKNNFYITVNSDSAHSTDPHSVSPKKNTTSAETNTVICIKNLEMGLGEKELGEILLKAFISTIKEINPLPSAIIFYNSAVNLTKRNSTVMNELESLSEMGIKILVCGTCTDFFDISDKIVTGTVSNMYEIMDELNKADKIIYP